MSYLGARSEPPIGEAREHRLLGPVAANLPCSASSALERFIFPSWMVTAVELRTSILLKRAVSNWL